MFSPTTTTTEVLNNTDLTSQVIMVTGAASGLGQETARALAAAGATVILAARDAVALDAALATIRAQHADAKLDSVLLDLTDFASIRACAAAVIARHNKLDVLINNAGVMACPLQRTASGCELQFGTNHIGHFLLTNLLLPLLKAAATPQHAARIVNLSSGGHKHAPLDINDLHWQSREYHKWQAYGQAKTANVLFTVELERRFARDNIHAYAVHPGAIATNLGRHLTKQDIEDLINDAIGRGKLVFKDIPAGAATSVWAATAAELEGKGGLYLEDCHIAPQVEVGNGESGYYAYAMEPATAQALWAASEKIVGLSLI